MKKDRFGYALLSEGDCLEFCRVIDGISNVLYGRIIKINIDSKSFDFEVLDNGISKKPTGEVFEVVTDKYIRGISWSTNFDE